MTTGIETLEEFGVCPESHWPYDIHQLNQSPDQRAFDEAQQLKITEALQLDLDLTQMKSCLAQGFPFAFGLSLFTSFDLAAKSGVVPLPDQHETSREAHGSHAMLAVGYSDQSNSFIVRNSWGKFWVNHSHDESSFVHSSVGRWGLLLHSLFVHDQPSTVFRSLDDSAHLHR